MSVLIYTESENGKLKKSAFEIASYAYEVAQMLNTTVTAVTFNTTETESLGNYGVSKVIAVNEERFNTFNASLVAATLKEVAEKEAATVVIVGSGSNDKYFAPLLAVNLNASYIPNVVAIPASVSPLKVKRTTFTNKAFAITASTTAKTIIGLSKNAYGLKENATAVTVENYTSSAAATGDITTKSTDKITGKVAIADADIVVSGGRGLKGPENWGMIEDLANVLGAATACSKPVSDMGWRPHSEHVGQTGKPVASNLYIAIGISGAIQHLAGVNASKVKVVINNDPEAPFFKAADYGVVGDAFEVVPQLIEKLKEFKANNA